jgi:hypothetical protein
MLKIKGYKGVHYSSKVLLDDQNINQQYTETLLKSHTEINSLKIKIVYSSVLITVVS